jgi:hypothetical protein
MHKKEEKHELGFFDSIVKTIRYELSSLSDDEILGLQYYLYKSYLKDFNKNLNYVAYEAECGNKEAIKAMKVRDKLTRE